MPYVAPTPKASNNQALSTVEYNIIVNDVIDLNARTNYVAGAIQTSPQTINQTSVASASNLLAVAAAFTADTSKLYRVEINCPFVELNGSGSSVQLHLVNTATGASIVEVARARNDLGGATNYCPLSVTYFLTPPSTTTSLQLRAIKASAVATNSVIHAGSGSGGALAPLSMYIFGPVS